VIYLTGLQEQTGCYKQGRSASNHCVIVLAIDASKERCVAIISYIKMALQARKSLQRIAPERIIYQILKNF